MKSFKNYITEASILMDLINKHDDPFSFLASAMDAIANGSLKLKTRGLANARELIATWNKKKKRKIKLKEAVEYLEEVIKVPIKIGDTVLGGVTSLVTGQNILDNSFAFDLILENNSNIEIEVQEVNFEVRFENQVVATLSSPFNQIIPAQTEALLQLDFNFTIYNI